ncbi:MAG: FkbM family methyltransferase [Sulfurospirillum cavolei]|nr:FkbM family methyltransferase [Sulfurospirillum cavolei]
MIHSFELLNENIRLFEYNNTLNKIKKQVYIKQAKAQGATSMFGNASSLEQVKTIKLDDYVIKNKIEKIDLIKMDIEGAEIPALEGALNTIRQFKPRLALCLYHKWDDVITIPRFLDTTGVDYRLYFKWVQLADGWDAVVLADPI